MHSKRKVLLIENVRLSHVHCVLSVRHSGAFGFRCDFRPSFADFAGPACPTEGEEAESGRCVLLPPGSEFTGELRAGPRPSQGSGHLGWVLGW